jgi:4-hydroxy-tetrahydrodipicolinate synthase
MALGTAGAVALGTTGLAAAAPAVGLAGGTVDRKHRKEWAREHFRGFENILLASFTSDLKELDEAGIRLDVRKSIEHGFFSSLCAPPALTVAEQKRFMEIVVDEAAGRISIALALHAPTEAEMLDVLAHAEKAGVQHILLDLPREGSAEDLIAYGRKFARATNLGVYLWMATVHNFARFHPNAIPYEVFDALADEPNVIALKVGNPDPAVIFELMQRYNDRMLIGSMMPNIMPLAIKAYGQQWSGAWSVEAIQSPEKPYAVDFFRLMMQKEYDPAMKLYWQHVAPGFAGMMKLLGRHMASGGHPWEHFKYYQFLTGGNGGRYRVDPEFPNLPPVGPEDKAMIQANYKMIGVPITTLPDEAFAQGRVNYERTHAARS